jgi:haloacetate dehalogenase
MPRTVREIGDAPLTPGFFLKDIEVANGPVIRVATAGSGPPVLLLHGHPHTHIVWRKVAPRLAEHFSVVATDLRGYGDSSKPPGGNDHINYSKREMAKDQVAVMRALGHSRFMLVGHDRGARVAHRLVLDHSDVVSKLVLLNIVSTAQTYARTDKSLATSQFWWFFLIQPEPLPEHMINGDREFFLRSHLDHQLKTPGALEPEAFAEYLRSYDSEATVHAVCEDYRAAAKHCDVMLPSIGQDAIDRGEADPDVVGDRLAQHAFACEPHDVSGLRLCCGLPAFVFALALGLGNALPLPLQHHLALELRDRSHNVQNELACRRARIEVHGEDAKRSLPLLDPSNDVAEVDDRARQTIDFGDDKHLPLADEAERLSEDRASATGSGERQRGRRSLNLHNCSGQIFRLFIVCRAASSSSRGRRRRQLPALGGF